MNNEIVRYQVNEYELTCQVAGQGEPLLLVHGSLCDYRYWQGQVQALSAHYRVIAPSLRHYFPEQWNGSGPGFSTRQHVADLLALIDQLSTPVHLLGHSRGGNICLRVALAAPQKLLSLTLADPGGDFADDVFSLENIEAPVSPVERNQFRQQALEMIRAGAVEEGLQLFVDTVSGVGVWSRSSRQFREMATANAMTLVGQVDDHPAPINHQQLAQLQLPVLLIGGAKSPEPFPRIIQALQATLVDGRSVTIHGASHGMNVIRPASFNRAVLEFIDQY
ncbi:pimeloyl-ACP methyl ester carboxylesterase [Pseudomonas nitritireducens]|uniref:Pimeloyl-ACP methyl ester carboxylesterase n=1 Tax=Pseudomonas nitroreducens TaxID=46680 RepID=A0A7W7P5N1_PSENT|nr:alpha/beta hydrolase [Pseudomonas nitritireducens]MBB4868144.1 pimeloyl-ACP methyl ester carboxylesterase [Pseudomonas nitritireducens]